MTSGAVVGPTVAMTVEQAWQRTPGGSGTYVAALTRALDELGGTRVVGLVARHGSGEVADPDFAPVVARTAASRLPRAALYEAWNSAGRPRAERIAREPLDLVHATTWAVPPTRLPLVVTVHDLAFLDEPSHFTPRGVRFFRRSLDRVRAEADRVVVPSQQTFDACVAAGMDASVLRLVPHGVRVAAPSPEAVSRFRSRHGLDRPYVLWCGTREPRKNLRGLLEAYTRAGSALEHDLVLVGPRGWGDLDLGAEDGAGRNGVRWLGKLSAAELASAYAGADVFCFPSFAEGFGMPALEAMAHGVPVVTSRGTPMADLVGDAGRAVDPGDADALADALVTVARARADWSAAALRRASAFTWEHAARLTAGVYGELA